MLTTGSSHRVALGLSINEIGQKIYVLRGQKVMLDNILAELYEVDTKTLKRAVRRNIARFPEDFMFELTESEIVYLKFKKGTSRHQQEEGHGGNRFSPFAFTEPGVAMLSSVLNSERAVQVNIAVMRAFIQLRQISEAHFDLVKRFDQLEQRNSEQFKAVLNAIQRPVAIPQVKKYRNNNNIETSQRSLLEAIQQAVAQYFELSIQDLTNTCRTREVVIPRQIAIYLVREHTDISLKSIGVIFGGRDHTTVLHSCRKISIAIDADNSIREAVQAIQNSFLS